MKHLFNFCKFGYPAPLFWHYLHLQCCWASVAECQCGWVPVWLRPSVSEKSKKTWFSNLTSKMLSVERLQLFILSVSTFSAFFFLEESNEKTHWCLSTHSNCILWAFFSGISFPGVLPQSAWSEHPEDSVRRFFFILSVSTLTAFFSGIVFSGCMLTLWVSRICVERLQLLWRRVSQQTEAHFRRRRCFSLRNHTFSGKPRWDDIGEAEVSHVTVRDTVLEFSE